MVASCGGTAEPTALVRGIVTYNDQPIAGQVTMFDSHGHPTFVETKQSGQYEIRAKIGLNQVAVSSRESSQISERKGLPPIKLAGKSRIPERYELPLSSGLTFTVQPGANQFDIALKD